MNAALKIDLRKADPLGLDFTAAYDRVRIAVDSYKCMGLESTERAGWYEHKLAREKHARTITDFVVLAKLIAMAVGEKRAKQVSGLKFALEFRGLDSL